MSLIGKQSTFYIFETQVKNHYKYGMTKQSNPYNRINQYSGLNKCSKLITMYSVQNGREEECKFFNFLNIKNIHIFSGKEFFYYENDINYLLNLFKYCKPVCKNIEQNGYKLCFTKGEYVKLKDVKNLFTTKDIEFYINCNCVSIKRIDVCNKCLKRPTGKQKLELKCCAEYDSTKRKTITAVIDTQLQKI